jgi:tRNA 2-selenouridine synthase
MKIEPINFSSLFLNDKILIDLRAPIEFQLGSIPKAMNLPLLTDEERHQVGITYKTHGQDAAITLGHKIVSGDIKAERLQKWIETIQINPDKSILFCFRGGLRSQTVQKWLQIEGYNCPIVSGGYKALRTYLISRSPPRLPVRHAS